VKERYHLRRPRSRWEDNGNIDLKDKMRGCGRIRLALDMEQ
jgi:hypothetical protein